MLTIKLLILLMLLGLAGCETTRDFMGFLGEFEVESPSGETTKCTVDKVACVQTCETVIEGHKIKKPFPMDPEECAKP